MKTDVQPAPNVDTQNVKYLRFITHFGSIKYTNLQSPFDNTRSYLMASFYYKNNKEQTAYNLSRTYYTGSNIEKVRSIILKDLVDTIKANNPNDKIR